MKHRLLIVLFLLSYATHGQALRDINFSYLYDPEEPIRFQLQPVRLADSWTILYSLELRDTAENVKNYIIEWQGRQTLNDKEGKLLNASIVDENAETAEGMAGSLSISKSDAPAIIVAKVVNGPAKRAYIFYCTLENNYPVTAHFSVDGKAYMKSYLSTKENITIADSSVNWIVSYYNDNFPPGAPAFSEGQAKVSKGMEADSVYVVMGGDRFNLPKKGLYLFQEDTVKSEGFALRAEDDYPKFTSIKSLPPAMVYICTKQEFDKLEASKGDKKIFDKTIMSIAGDPDRAKKLIRSYFRRIEYANLLFTSFKEGWKTDRGMIFIIFGSPDEVFRFNDKEVWNYQDPSFNITFNFSKAPNIFAPDNYVLMRDNKYQAIWYEVVDLWRKSRF